MKHHMALTRSALSQVLRTGTQSDLRQPNYIDVSWIWLLVEWMLLSLYESYQQKGVTHGKSQYHNGSLHLERGCCPASRNKCNWIRWE